MEDLKHYLEQSLTQLLHWFSSPAFYAQLGLISVAFMLAWSAHLLLRRVSPLLREANREAPLFIVRNSIYQCRELLLPLFIILFMMSAADLADDWLAQSWLVRAGAGLAIVFMIYSIIRRFISNPLLQRVIKLIAIPIALLHVFGFLDDITSYLDSKTLELGNISISAYGVARAIIFGIVLFWIGRAMNSFGQQLIRQQDSLNIGTREIFAKVYQVLLFFIISLLLLQIMGVNITALAVFGGAVGVGLGFGLQSIASNFISGIILLVDRSLKIGDYIELEDGRKGTVIKLNMRYTALETFDGKEIMVPNEKFITTSFTNWTHSDPRQRYSVELQVAYHTDLHQLFSLLKQTVASHPQVISGPDISPELAVDAEIQGFGDSGVNILIEFWMEGIDDGRNRVGGDLLLLIWEVLRENQVEIPFPQREVRIINHPSS